MRTEAEISHLWQLAHLKFYFGEKLAVRSMQSVHNPAMDFATCRDENEFRPSASGLLDSQAGSSLCGKKSADDGAGTEGLRTKEGACCSATASRRQPEMRDSKRPSFGLIRF